MGLSDLANETILSIVANLFSVSDINGLVLANRRLYRLLNWHLYRWDVRLRYLRVCEGGDIDQSMGWSSEQG